ncbi:hypothetical protein [Mesorhizobium caraganae]|uniref:hypothetical protein n=1 Tax=Mesorhizobium caraganae TaxID=483206 RepID=UPI00333CDCA2
MSGKPAIFPALDYLPIQAQDHAPPASFDINELLLAAAPNHPTGPAEHFAPHATVDLPDAGLAGIENASHLPTHISDWLLI